jgi:alcohol dehydrogenase
VSFVEAAALGCRFTTAYRAVIQQGLQMTDANYPQGHHMRKPERTVCVFGCGGLGLSCIMIAKAYQKEGNIKSIIGVDISQNALVKAVELGADHVINSNGLTNDEVAQQVLDLTYGLGCELCIDAAGFPSSCEQAVISTRRGCRMVQVGLPIGGRPPEINMGMVAGRELELVGSHGFSATNLPDLLNLVKSGKLNVKKLIEKEVTLEEGAKALMDMDSQSPLGMTVITKFQQYNSRM